jgi:hypothetical protein
MITKPSAFPYARILRRALGVALGSQLVGCGLLPGGNAGATGMNGNGQGADGSAPGVDGGAQGVDASAQNMDQSPPGADASSQGDDASSLSGRPVTVTSSALSSIVISLGKPVVANYGNSMAAAAVDSDYGTQWRSYHTATTSDPDWLAIDISTVSATQRASVYSVWFNETGYNYQTSDGSSYSLPGDFQIQANAGAGGGMPPTAGWSTLVTVSGNTLSSGANLLALGSYNWVRFLCTAGATNVAAQNTDTGLQWELHDAHGGVVAWKFGGDSITANSMGHVSTNDSFDQLVNLQRTTLFPAFEMAGHADWSTANYLAVIDAFLANFPGQYYGLALGTNDVTDDPATFNANMTMLINKVIAAGKIPVVPTIPYTGDPDYVSAIPGLNTQIQMIYASFGSKLIQGPDLYTLISNGKATFFDTPTDLHPNAAGDAAIRKAWADAMVKEVYP